MNALDIFKTHCGHQTECATIAECADWLAFVRHNDSHVTVVEIYRLVIASDHHWAAEVPTKLGVGTQFVFYIAIPVTHTSFTFAMCA